MKKRPGFQTFRSTLCVTSHPDVNLLVYSFRKLENLEVKQPHARLMLLLGFLVTAWGVLLFLNGILWLLPLVVGPGLMILSLVKLNAANRQSPAQKLGHPEAKAKGFLIRTAEFEATLGHLAASYPQFFQGPIVEILITQHLQLSTGHVFTHRVKRSEESNEIRFQIRIKKRPDGNTALVFRGDPQLLAMITAPTAGLV